MVAWNAVLLASMLFSGAINTTTKKFQFETCVESIHPSGNQDTSCPEGEEKFKKPWFQNCMMFLGEASVLAYFVRQRRLNAYTGDHKLRDKRSLILALPALCDVLGTGIGGVGLMYVSAAVWQMLRGSIIVFTALFSKFFLKRDLKIYHGIAVGVSVAGLGCVGLGAILEGRHSGGGDSGGGNVLAGIFFVVLSQVFAAIQMVLEEVFVKSRDYPAPLIVGGEGAFGIAYMLIILFFMQLIPGSDHGAHENTIDSLYKVGHSFALDCFILIYCASIAFYNFLGVTVTARFSAIHRTLIDSMRTLVVWVVELAVYYIFSNNYGKALSSYWLLELFGFSLLVVGSLCYNAVVRIPGLEYPPPQANDGMNEELISSISSHHASTLRGSDHWEQAIDVPLTEGQS